MRAFLAYEHDGTEYHANLMTHADPADEMFWVEKMAPDYDGPGEWIDADAIAALETALEVDIYAALCAELGWVIKTAAPGTRRHPPLVRRTHGQSRCTGKES